MRISRPTDFQYRVQPNWVRADRLVELLVSGKVCRMERTHSVYIANFLAREIQAHNS